MNATEAHDKAFEIVCIYMTRGDIEDACEERGIRVVKNRATMEKKLIAAMTAEFEKKGCLTS